jgi:hypothetical protein
MRLSIDRDTLTRRLALTGVIVSATILSYSTLHHRAIAIGIPEWSAWFYPILFDAFILGASRMWQNAELSDETRRASKYATLTGISAAVLAFIAEFWPRGPVAVSFALVIPVVLAWSLVLTSRAAADRRIAPETLAEPVLVPTEGQATSAPVSVSLEGSEPQSVRMEVIEPGVAINAEPVTFKIPTTQILTSMEFEPTDKRAWIHAQLDKGAELTGADINKKFGGRNGARDLRSVLKEREPLNGHTVKAST